MPQSSSQNSIPEVPAGLMLGPATLEHFARVGPEAVRHLRFGTLPNAAKLSAQLLDFAAPLVSRLHHPGEEPEREAGLKFAMLAWNAALSQEAFDNIVAGFDGKFGGSAREPGGLVPQLRWLVRRRLEHFGDDPRLIGAVHFERLPHDHHVSVLGAMLPAREAPARAVLPAPELREVEPDATADPCAALTPLFVWGDPDDICRCLDHDWSVGFGKADVPALIALARKWGGFDCGEDDPYEAIWAPFHAWRVLRCLADPEAIEPLLGCLDVAASGYETEHCDEFVRLCDAVGGPQLPLLSAFLRDPSHHPEARGLVAEAISGIAIHHPQYRADGLSALLAQLASHPDQDRRFNGYLVAVLSDMKAIEAEPLVAEAFAAGRVDPEVCGHLRDVLAYLRGESLPMASLFGHFGSLPRKQKPTAKEKARAGRKRQKQARRKSARRKR